MKHIIPFIAVLILFATLVMMAFITIDVATANYETGVTIVGKRFTRPDTYELCYREQFENGLVIERWIVVDKEKYLAWEAEK